MFEETLIRDLQSAIDNKNLIVYYQPKYNIAGDEPRLIEIVENLRTKGFRIEMDDFGDGYSSLNMITTLPIDILKIDMSFVRNMEKSELGRLCAD